MKMASSEKQVAQLTQALESLMREKKELEVKERIMRDSLNGITEHMDHLFAHKASLTPLFPGENPLQSNTQWYTYFAVNNDACSAPEVSTGPLYNREAFHRQMVSQLWLLS